MAIVKTIFQAKSCFFSSPLLGMNRSVDEPFPLRKLNRSGMNISRTKVNMKGHAFKMPGASGSRINGTVRGGWVKKGVIWNDICQLMGMIFSVKIRDI